MIAGLIFDRIISFRSFRHVERFPFKRSLTCQSFKGWNTQVVLTLNFCVSYFEIVDHANELVVNAAVYCMEGGDLADYFAVTVSFR